VSRASDLLIESQRELEAASAVIVLWSNGSMESQWVPSEPNRARELGKLVRRLNL